MTNNGLYNLFIPLNLGGLGFPLCPEVKAELIVTKFQRRFATFLLSKIQESLLLGKYPKKYLFALVTDNSPLKSYVRRAGCPTLKLGGPEAEEGWELFKPLPHCTFGPLSSGEDVMQDEKLEYRFPPRSIIRSFNRTQFDLVSGRVKDSIISSAMSDKELFSDSYSFIHRKLHSGSAFLSL